jgi:hypothetical protein
VPLHRKPPPAEIRSFSGQITLVSAYGQEPARNVLSLQFQIILIEFTDLHMVQVQSIGAFQNKLERLETGKSLVSINI